MTSKERKLHVQYVASIATLVAGIGLLIAGFCVPPHGVIDASVLTAFGEIITFAGTVWGIGNATDRKVYEIERKYNDIERHTTE